MNPEEVDSLIGELEGEVNNGGLHQFFNNSAGDDTAEVLLALEAIGATAVADILRRAASRFPGNMPPKNRTERLEVLWQCFPEANEFHGLDAEFFAYPDDLAGLLAQYKSKLSNK